MAEYTFDVQKLYLEMFLADAESFARACCDGSRGGCFAD